MLKFIKKFLELEAASGLVLIAAAALALVLANSGAFSSYYDTYIASAPSLQSFVNDGLMAVFFFMVGLEIKREIVDGELSTRAKALFPVATALGGVVVPALIYLWFNAGTESARGWAIPSATDIAFSLGVLSLFGSRVPHALKIFLMALAVIDDLAAVLIITVFYTGELSLHMLAPAGAMLGMLMPMRANAKILERIHPWVAFGIMPLFAFVNAGVAMQNVQPSQLLNALPLGIVMGLFLGKQLGIMLVAGALVFARKSPLPEGTGWLEFYAVSVLAGIGFTMSLFIGNLAFVGNTALLLDMKLGVMAGSLLSAIVGCALMAIAIQKRK